MNNYLLDLQQIKNVYNTEKQIIKFGLLNIRSLSTKTLFVNDMVTDHNLDVLCFTETWLKHKMYCTPYKRYLMKLSSNPNCSLCNNNSKGTFLHMFWDCSVISNFWKHVVQVLKRITKLELDLDPCLMLLNDDSSYNFTLVQRRLLMSGFTAAKKNYYTAMVHTWHGS